LTQIIDTKYIEIKSFPESSHIVQVNLYSDIKNIDKCSIVYPGNSNLITYNLEKIGLSLYVIFIDLSSEAKIIFNERCDEFIQSIKQIKHLIENDQNSKISNKKDYGYSSVYRLCYNQII
jgi:hypothetical protein